MPYKDAETRRSKDREYKRLRRARDGEYLRTYWRARPRRQGRIRHSERESLAAFIKKYGITKLERDQIFVSQDRKCAVCGTQDPGKHKWQTDHCHERGYVRGVLCWPCNVAIGQLRHDPSRLRRAADYLEQYEPD